MPVSLIYIFKIHLITPCKERHMLYSTDLPLQYIRGEDWTVHGHHWSSQTGVGLHTFHMQIKTWSQANLFLLHAQLSWPNLHQGSQVKQTLHRAVGILFLSDNHDSITAGNRCTMPSIYHMARMDSKGFALHPNAILITIKALALVISGCK